MADRWQYDAGMKHDGAVVVKNGGLACNMHQRRTAFCRGETDRNSLTKVQYGDACLSLQQVYKWTRKFMNGISSVTDSP